ncbi:MAG: hypothetical protein Q8N06_02905 [Hydrogenophaga sp.]|nr:hypothetical protein [Hydrogenophaga sp.]
MNSTIEFYPGEDLPFITIPSGDRLGAPINYLDVHVSTYCEGVDSGMRAAYRLMFACERGVLTTYRGERDEDLDETVRAAIEFAANELAKPDDRADDGVRGAAVGFLGSVARMLGDLAQCGVWRMTMMKDIADTDNYNRTEFEGQLAANATLVADVMPSPSVMAAAAAPVDTKPARSSRKAVAALA